MIVAAIILTTIGIKASDSYFFSKQQPVNSVGSNQCPVEMVFVAHGERGFCLDKYEAAPAKSCPYSEPANQSETRINIDYPGCGPESRAGRLPWRFISKTQAEIACAKVGKELPTPEEWYYAALGTPDLNANWSSADCQVAKNWSTQPGLSGSGKNCVSTAGVYDLIGNVWEWVAGEANNGKYQDLILPVAGYITDVSSQGLPIATAASPDTNHNNDYIWLKPTGVRAIAKGGFWENEFEAGIFATYTVLAPAEVSPGLGFRCVKRRY